MTAYEHEYRASTPEGRAGIYKSVSSVPPERRFENYAAAYDGRDTWGEWIATERADLKRAKEDIERAGRRWKAHLDERGSGRHHALATAADVETWVQYLRERGGRNDGMTWQNTVKCYINHLWAFYRWLCRRSDHPHVYDPTLIAASEPESYAREAWRVRFDISGWEA
jgi:hypothetical protein